MPLSKIDKQGLTVLVKLRFGVQKFFGPCWWAPKYESIVSHCDSVINKHWNTTYFLLLSINSTEIVQ